jgi:hypothetical protein
LDVSHVCLVMVYYGCCESGSAWQDLIVVWLVPWHQQVAALVPKVPCPPPPQPRPQDLHAPGAREEGQRVRAPGVWQRGADGAPDGGGEARPGVAVGRVLQQLVCINKHRSLPASSSPPPSIHLPCHTLNLPPTQTQQAEYWRQRSFSPAAPPGPAQAASRVLYGNDIAGTAFSGRCDDVMANSGWNLGVGAGWFRGWECLG